MENEKSFRGVLTASQNDAYDGSNIHKRRQDIPFHRWLITIICALAILGTTIFTNNPWWAISRATIDHEEDSNPSHVNSEFQWTKLEPSRKLSYVPCYEGFYCARLEVPLDWTSTDPNSARAVLAVIKRPAEVDVTHPAYGGAIFFNPGGPGGPGTQFLRGSGESLSTILNGGSPSSNVEMNVNSSRFYDLMSWDPRGVLNTIPRVEGLANPLVRAEFDQRFFDTAGEMEHPEMFHKAYKMKGIYGKVLSSPQDNTPDEEHPGRFVGTTSVVRDMVELIEKHGEWREEAAEKILKIRYGASRNVDTAEIANIRQRTRYVKGEEKLQYWGFSYGTIVGQTFATMYPERVGRVAIDGVVNITDYYAGDWRTELIDTEKINRNFSMECEIAGPEVCPLAKLTSGTNEKLIDGFERTLGHMHDNPIGGLVGKNPIYVTDFLLKSLIHVSWYDGLTGYPVAAKMLWNAATRNVSFFDVKGLESPVCDDSPEAWIDQGSAQSAIVCTDADSKINETAEEFYEYVKHIYDQSPNFAYSLTRVMLPCHGYSLRPKWRFNGPWGAETANPLLVLSQTLDPITPLISAKGAASLFPGSQVVEAQGIGHCTLGWPSLCAMKHVKKYFDTGKVPEEYTYCPASVKPFSSLNDVVQMTDDLPLEDRYMMASAVKIAKNYPLLDNEALQYGEQADLPDETMGNWWSTSRQIRISTAMEELVHLQY